MSYLLSHDLRSTFSSAVPSAETLGQRPNPIKMYSSVSAGTTTAVDMGIDYWCRVLTDPCFFDEAMSLMLEEEKDVDILMFIF